MAALSRGGDILGVAVESRDEDSWVTVLGRGEDTWVQL